MNAELELHELIMGCDNPRRIVELLREQKFPIRKVNYQEARLIANELMDEDPTPEEISEIKTVFH